MTDCNVRRSLFVKEIAKFSRKQQKYHPPRIEQAKFQQKRFYAITLKLSGELLLNRERGHAAVMFAGIARASHEPLTALFSNRIQPFTVFLPFVKVIFYERKNTRSRYSHVIFTSAFHVRYFLFRFVADTARLAASIQKVRT